MTATDEFDRSISYGESALTYLKGNRTPAFPRNYELWYTYAAGFNRELNRAVNDTLKRVGRLTPDLTDRFYEEFLSPVRLTDRVGEVSGEVAGELNEILKLLETSGKNVDDYGRTLDAAARGLSTAAPVEQILEIVAEMKVATARMEQQNGELQNQLLDSHRQIKDLQESLDTIRFESLIDQLTGLANRKHFDESLEKAVESALRRGEPLALVMCDIDHFKKFNDTYGHQTGDQVLRLVGAAIKASVKGRDIAARYGGEEFAVILPFTEAEQAVTVANQIRSAVMAKELIKRSTGESLGRITMSAGVAELCPGDTVDSIIERADSLLYMSKKRGRNCVTSQEDGDGRDLADAVA